MLAAGLVAALTVFGGCRTSETSVSSTGAAKFGLDQEGRMTVSTRGDDGNWDTPGPLTPELDAAYEDILGRKPIPGEAVTW
jgi:hypothetical protein